MEPTQGFWVLPTGKIESGVAFYDQKHGAIAFDPDTGRQRLYLTEGEDFFWHLDQAVLAAEQLLIKDMIAATREGKAQYLAAIANLKEFQQRHAIQPTPIPF